MFTTFTFGNLTQLSLPSGNSGASVIVFAPAAVTLHRSWPRPRAWAAEIGGPLSNQGGNCGSLPGLLGPRSDQGGNRGSVPGPDKLSQ